MEEQLTVLIRQRDAVAEKLDRVKAAIKTDKLAPNQNLKKMHFLKVQLRTVETCYGEFNSFQNQIYGLALTQDQEKQHRACYLKFEVLHNTLLIQLEELVEELAKQSAALVPSAPAVVAPQYLPPLPVPLPTFDGTCETWYTFKSMFQNVMARYTAETPAIKLYHLRNSLVGKAAGVIDQDIVNGNDYEMAWAILEERFEDKRAIVDKHIDAVYALSRISHDNAAELRTLIDTCVKHIEALKALQLPVEGLGEQMLVNLLASRMDFDTRRAWEGGQKAGVLPTYAATIAFLKERCRVLERVQPNSEPPQRSVALVIAEEARCTMCNQQHPLKNCKQFSKKSLNEKFSHLRKHGLCFNCLLKGHCAGQCSLSNKCQKCTRRHHIMLHPDGTKKPETTPKSTVSVAPTSKDKNHWRRASSPADCAERKKATLLPTAVVRVYGLDGVPHLCRTLIDSCSQNNFVTERFANQLAVKKERVACDVSGLNGRSTRICHSVRTAIESRVTEFSKKLEFLVTPGIIDDMPPGTLDISSWNLPSNVEFADPTFNKTGSVDMLLGAEVFWDLLKTGSITLAEGLPSLRETELGWVVGGALPTRRAVTERQFCGVFDCRR